MAWRAPNDLECVLLADTRERWPEVLPLARLLVLAPRIEPLLLRNARERFLPEAGAELESQLWFSPLVAARGTRDIVLHLGIARVLAGQLTGAAAALDDPCPRGRAGQGAVSDAAPSLDTLWAFTREHTRHWPPEDRLERDLRYHALRGDDAAVNGGLRAILARVAEESAQEDLRVGLSRLAKRTLPVIRPGLGGDAADTARLLARYAAEALGDPGDWTRDPAPQAMPSDPEPLPAWLRERLPTPLAVSRLGAEVRYDDDHGQVLHLTEPVEGAAAIEFPSPLPARLHVAPGGRVGDWFPVKRGTRILIRPPSAALRLTNWAGQQWDLVTESLPAAPPEAPSTEPLLLLHAAPDADQAAAIADWLRAQGIAVDLLAESPQTGRAADAAARGSGADGRAIRLWTRTARDLWAKAERTPDDAAEASLLLRIEEVEPPTGGADLARLLDWQDWQRLADSPEASRLLDALRRWWQDGSIPEDAQQVPRDGAPAGGSTVPPPAGSKAGEETARQAQLERLIAVLGQHLANLRAAETRDAEIERLIAELADPATEPPRRLEIGDRLDALGDPRPGVGTVEIEVPVAEAGQGAAAPEPWAKAEAQSIHDVAGYPPEVQALIDEINDPETPPGRRLEIGDLLDKLGDPRPGVALLPNGLPDIAWVEIPAGPFIWQDGETRELPTFWISRYPVTNAQCQAFIDDGGYEGGGGLFGRLRKALGPGRAPSTIWWHGLKQPRPASPQWLQDNRPRTDVDWYEAVAFTRWLNARLALPDDSIRLPTELEWEKAARGEQGLVYPWGPEYRSGYANVDETDRLGLGGGKAGPWFLEQPTAVGLYPHGCSPYAVEDMAGTVWEWCQNKYENLEDAAPDTSGASRALRGGSWFNHPHYARGDYRRRLPPGDRYDHGGFRLLSSVPIDAVR